MGGFEDFGVTDKIVWIRDFVDEGGDDLLLVLAAVAVAGRIGITFTSVDEGAFGIEMLLPFYDIAVITFKCGIGFNIDTIDSIDNFNKCIEADLGGIVNFNGEQILNSLLAHFDTVDAGVGELIAEAGGAVELDVVIARDGHEENAEIFWIDDKEHINVAAGGFGDVATGIGAGNVENKWFGSDIDRLAVVWCVHANFKFINLDTFVDEIRIGFFKKIQIALIQDNSGYFKIINAGNH